MMHLSIDAGNIVSPNLTVFRLFEQGGGRSGI